VHATARIAALSISQRNLGRTERDLGREVGCKIRFDDRSSPDTYIKLMTDGILLPKLKTIRCSQNTTP
jgi:ATP-dependent helicase HrpA